MSGAQVPREAMQALESISASLTDLVSLNDGANREALQSISVALSEMVQLLEASRDAAAGAETARAQAMLKIAESVSGLNLAPEIHVNPTINVPRQPLEVSVKAGDNHIHVQAPATQEASFKTLKIEFQFKGDQITGAEITRQE